MTTKLKSTLAANTLVSNHKARWVLNSLLRENRFRRFSILELGFDAVMARFNFYLHSLIITLSWNENIFQMYFSLYNFRLYVCPSARPSVWLRFLWLFCWCQSKSKPSIYKERFFFSSCCSCRFLLFYLWFLAKYVCSG